MSSILRTGRTFIESRWSLWVWPLSLIVCFLSSIATADPLASRAQHAQLSPKAICDVLAWREGKFANCTFSFSEDRRLFHPSQAGDMLLSTDNVSVKSKMGNMVIDFSEKQFENHLLDVSHSLQGWDGTKCTWLQNVRISKDSTELQGGVEDSAPHILYLTSAFTMLGLRQYEEPRPWSKWIASKLELKGTDAEVSQDTVDGERRVKFVLIPADDPYIRYSWTFLPDKDFAARDFALAVTQGNTGGTSHGWRVEDYKQFDGFWIPTKIAYSKQVMQNGNRGTVNITSFSLKPPSDQEMQIRFPVGTHVIDAIKQQCYTVLPNGKRRYESSYDGATKKTIDPPADATRAQPAATQP